MNVASKQYQNQQEEKAKKALANLGFLASTILPKDGETTRTKFAGGSNPFTFNKKTNG